jgi:hypothetical protein
VKRQVSAVIVVHQTTAGELALPAATTRDLAWVRAEDAVHNIRAHLLNGRQTVSRNAVAALVARDRRPPMMRKGFGRSPRQA